ncbi:hypothetical protein EEDFHM_03530 [Methylorubrum populi]
MTDVPWGAIATLFGVGVAGGIAYAGYRLNRRKEIREVEASEPRFEVTLGRLDGIGPWPLHIKVTNRDEGPITVQRLSFGKERRFELSGGDDGFVVSFPGVGAQYAGRDWIDIEQSIEAKASHIFRAALSSVDGRRVPSNIQPEIVMTIGFSDRTSRVKRFKLICTENQ